MNPRSHATASPAPAFLAGGGEMGERIRRHDWGSTPLGPPEGWPEPLRTVVRLMLSSHHAILVFWGPALIGLYNDAGSHLLDADKQAAHLGRPAKQAWPESWALIGPRLQHVMQGRGAVWLENDRVPIRRQGRVQDAWWTYSYDPIGDEDAPGGVGGVLVLCTETTAQVRAQQSLAAAGMRWRSWFEHAPGFVCVLSGPQHRYEYANPRYQHLVGERRLIGRTVLEALPEVQSQGFIHLLDRVFEQGEPYVASAAPITLQRLARGPGERRHLDLAFEPLRDACGQVTGILVQGTDVTERVQAAEALADSEARYRVLAEHLPGGAVFVIDPSLRYVMAAGEALQADARTDDGTAGGTGHGTSADFVGRTLAEVLGPVQAEALEAACRGGLAGTPFELEHLVGERFFLSRGAPLRHTDGPVYAVLVVSIDITLRRSAEQQLREAQARLEGVMAAAEVGVWSWDLARDVIDSDLNLARLYGLGALTQASPAAHFERIHADDRPAMQAAIDQALATGRLDMREYRVTDAQGSTRWLAGRGRMYRNAQGQPERLTGLVIDITELKLLEQSLQASDRQKDEFLAILAHELRNPLAPLLAAVRVLDQAAPGSRDIARCRDVIHRQVQQMAVLLDDLLDVSRIKYGRLRLNRRIVTLAEVVNAAVETAMPWIEERGHAFVLALPPEPVLLQADPGRIAQVLANLLGNAAKYTPAGGHLALRARLTGAAPGGEVDIAVQDDGIGLSAADQAHIFQMFTQIEAGSALAQGGLGIGLALVNGLVELHGGRVRVDSDGPGRGSVFTVSLPVRAPADLPAPPGPQPPSALRGRHILIADDNADAAEMLSLYLTLSGHTTRVVHDGREAVAAYDAAVPDIALIDIGMPGLDGYAVARHIRRHPRGPRPLLVALTGWGQEDDKLKADAAGFDLHFTKPVDPEALMRRIESVLPGPPQGRGR